MNDEAQMSNDETMTKSENRNTSADESFWYNHAESTVREEPEKPRVYDLEERTARFGEAIIDFAKTIPQNPITNRLISQLIGASTSVGANYAEADDSVSKKDFLVRAVPELKPQARTLWLEEKELNLIFSKIWRSK
jgi:hypothetical protein